MLNRIYWENEYLCPSSRIGGIKNQRHRFQYAARIKCNVARVKIYPANPVAKIISFTGFMQVEPLIFAVKNEIR